MTISSEYAPLTYTAGFLFPFTFPILDTDHLVVTFTSTTGTQTVLTEGTHYTITGWQRAGDTGSVSRHETGGSADYPLASGESIELSRVVPFTQPTDLVNETQFFQNRIEEGLDRVTMLVQQLDDQASGTLLQLPDPEADKLLGWNSTADALENKDVGDLTASEALQSWIADTFTGNGTTTAYSLTRSPGGLGNLDVSINGVVKVPTTDYLLSGQVVTFTTPPANSSTILIRYGYAAAQVTTAFLQELQTATASQTVFNLTSAYTPNGNAMSVYQNGLRLTPGTDYTETSTTSVTLISPAALADELLFVYGAEQNYNVVSSANILDGAVTAAKLASDAVITAKIQDAAVTVPKLSILASPISIVATGITATLNKLHKISGTSSSYTITLPTAIGNSGSLLWFQVAPYASASKQYTLSSTELIDGVASLVLIHTNSILLMSDGANWNSIEKHLSTPWVNDGAVTVTGTTTNPTKGAAVTTDAVWWRRVGDSMDVRIEYAQTAGGTAGSGDVLFKLPDSFTVDTAKLTANGTAASQPKGLIGFGRASSSQTTGAIYALEVYDSTHIRGNGIDFDAAAASNDVFTSAAAITFATATYRIAANYTVPITNW